MIKKMKKSQAKIKENILLFLSHFKNSYYKMYGIPTNLGYENCFGWLRSHLHHVVG